MGIVRADLHCHSTHSDGSLTPHELLELAKETGLTGLAITDHDSISAFQCIEKELAQYAIDLLTGVELSTTLEDNSEAVQVHVLGYAFDQKALRCKNFASVAVKIELSEIDKSASVLPRIICSLKRVILEM